VSSWFYPGSAFAAPSPKRLWRVGDEALADRSDSGQLRQLADCQNDTNRRVLR